MGSQVSAAPATRWYGVGHSTSVDAARAGAEATAAALAGRDASLLVVFCSVAKDLPGLLDGVARSARATTQQDAKRVAIVGCTTMGQVVCPGVGAGPDGVVVAALGGDGFEVWTQVSREVSSRQREAGMEASGCLARVERPHRVCLLLSDGLTGEQHEVVRGAYSVVGAGVPLVGGCAADELSYSRTYQFHGDQHGVEVLSDAVVGVAIGSDAPFGIGIAHGWRKLGEPMVVTSSNGGRLYQLDHEPALEVYLRRTGMDRSLLDDLDAFRQHVFNRPLGLSRRSGEDIRVVHDFDVADGSLVCLADVPQGALAWLMETDAESLVMGAKESFTQALAGLGGAAPIGLLAFDCGARKVMLGPDGLRQEVDAMASVMGNSPFGGFYTFGEIARTNGARGMHHLTLVSLALA
jgi:hypothetical protein